MSPTKNNENFESFLNSLNEYEPVIPEELIRHITKQYGSDLPDNNSIKMLVLAIEQLMQDVFQHVSEISENRERLPLTRSKDLGFVGRDKSKRLLFEELVKAFQKCSITIPYVQYYPKSQD